MNEMSPHISIDRDAVSAFWRRYHIQRLALFGLGSTALIVKSPVC